MTPDPNAPLLVELRWFVQQRWLAGVVVTLSVIVSLIWNTWSPQHLQILNVGMFILLYNMVFWRLFVLSPQWLDIPVAQRKVAWAQLTLDLACLTLLATFTGGILSPLLGLFVLHMIFASLLLQPPHFMSYIAWTVAIIFMATALALSGQWPSTPVSRLFALGWMGTLLITIYITSHITNNVRVNHDRTRAVLDAAADGVLTIDDSGYIKLANPAALHMFNLTSKQIINQKINKLIPLVHLPEISINDNADPTLIDNIATNDEPELLAIHNDGTTFPVEVTIRRMNGDSPEAFTATIRDMTQHKRTEATLRKLNRELKKQQEQLVQHEKMIAVGRMAAGVAHEISNPLANMDGLIQLVQRHPQRMKTDTPDLLREQIKRITQIVRQLKDFAYPVDTDKRTLPIDELVQAAMDMIRFDKRHRNISFNHKVQGSNRQVCVHPQSIQQVLVNVIINALDAVAEKEDPRVTISSQCLDESFCRISITDNGIGIPEEHLERIFEPFYTTKPLGQGTGLGLSISYNLIQRDGGHIDVQSTPGSGTTVSISLPVAGIHSTI